MEEDKYKQPLVTVIIATYNRADTLQYAIESVLWQTYRNFELWVIGDHCTDHTEETVNKYTTDPRVHFYNLPVNSGYQSRPNNEGIKRAKGDYIAYLNHDDLWLPNHLQDTIAHISKTQADFVFSVMQWVYSFAESRADIPLLPTMPKPPEATAVVHRKDVVDKIGYWKDIHETYAYPRVEFFRDAYRANMKFEIVPSLTALKFLWDEKEYSDVGPQPLYLERVRKEKDYANKELSAMLIHSYHELGQPVTLQRLKTQIGDLVRRKCIEWRLDPARLKFWHTKGTQIRIWRSRHGLKNSGTLKGKAVMSDD